MNEKRDRESHEVDAPREDEITEAEIDENLDGSFPASDPPSWTLGTDHGRIKPREHAAPTHEKEKR